MKTNNISVTEPIGKAVQWTSHVLLSPFDIAKWLTIGFCAWLALLGNNGKSFPSFNFHRGSYNYDVENRFHSIADFVMRNVILISAIAVCAFIVIVIITLLIYWLKSRGEFMFLDCTIKNRGAVVEPWQQFKHPANSLFIFRALLMCAFFLLFFMIAAISFVIALPDVTNRVFDIHAVISCAVGAPLLLVLIVAFALLKNILTDFIVPIMYKKNVAVIQAFDILSNHLLKGNILYFVLFYFMKIGLSIIINLIIIIIGLATCCIACCAFALPFFGTVLLLPVFMFKRLYSIFFLEQFGEEWKFIDSSFVK